MSRTFLLVQNPLTMGSMDLLENLNGSVAISTILPFDEDYDQVLGNGTELLLQSSACISHNITINGEVNFVFRGLGVLFVALFGVSANVLSVIVLSHPGLKSSLSTLLLGLTISDVFVISTSLLIFSLSAIFDYVNVLPWFTKVFLPHILPWMLPIALSAQMSSIYFTVMITLERYIAVCYPLKARSLCTRSTAQHAALAVVVTSILYNIPRWFEYHTTVAKPNSNSTTGYIEYAEEETEFRCNEMYLLYYVNWAYFVVIYLIPFTMLLLFNIAIYRETKKRRSRRTSLCPNQTMSNNEEVALAGMLFAIVITFIACNMLSLVINVMESFEIGIRSIGNLIPISDFLIVFSCSTNFVFYCVFGTKFRKSLVETLSIKSRTSSRGRSFLHGDLECPDLTQGGEPRRPQQSKGNSCIRKDLKRPSTDSETDIVWSRSERSCSQQTVQTIISEEL